MATKTKRKPASRRPASLDKRKAKSGWLFVAPFVIGFIVIYLPIIINSIIYSFSEFETIAAIDGGGYILHNVGFDNYKNALFVDTEFVKVLTTGIRQLLLEVPAIVIFSLFLAVILNEKMVGRAAFRAILFVPVILQTGLIAEIDAANTLLASITVTMKEVDELVECGVDILAVQGTGALRPDGSTSAQFIRAIKAKYPDQLVMADCDNFENAMACAEAGADFVGTTMRGYTPETKGIDDIDFDFVHKLAAECPAKVIAEGHIHYPEQAVKALEAGAFALVVGGAITRPAEITARFTGAINAARK